MNTLELFSGTESFSNVAHNLGHSCFTIDNDKDFNPDLCVDILKIDGNDIVLGLMPDGQRPDVLWASPPCEGFSVASIGANWTGGKKAYIPRGKSAFTSIALAEKTIKLIEEINPKWWFIENPRGLLRHMQFMQEFVARNGGTEHTVWYCKYGDTRAKPTNIWTNFIDWESRPECKNYKYDKEGKVIDRHCHHEEARRGAKTGTQGIGTYKDRSRIPADLFKEIFNQIPQ